MMEQSDSEAPFQHAAITIEPSEFEEMQAREAAEKLKAQ